MQSSRQYQDLMIKAFNFNVSYLNQMIFEIRIPTTGFHFGLNDMLQLKMILGGYNVKQVIWAHFENFCRHFQRDWSSNQIFHYISCFYPVYKSIPDKDDDQDFLLGYQFLDIECNFFLLKQSIELCKQLKSEK
ncbi:hypothetical protein pb186bvf_019394 [Paramecium bursaria]